MGRRPSDPHLFTLGAQLDELARTNPKVAAAAKAFDDAAERIITGRAEAAHALPCILVNCQWHNPAWPDPPRGFDLHELAMRRFHYDPEFHARADMVAQVADVPPGPKRLTIIATLAVDDITRSRMA
jgi:hypothetical protein